MLEKKQNVFDDFIAVAETLISEKYTSPAKLGIMGDRMAGCWLARSWSSARSCSP
jgi:prolyl oligopeptidase